MFGTYSEAIDFFNHVFHLLITFKIRPDVYKHLKDFARSGCGKIIE